MRLRRIQWTSGVGNYGSENILSSRFHLTDQLPTNHQINQSYLLIHHSGSNAHYKNTHTLCSRTVRVCREFGVSAYVDGGCARGESSSRRTHAKSVTRHCNTTVTHSSQAPSGIHHHHPPSRALHNAHRIPPPPRPPQEKTRASCGRLIMITSTARVENGPAQQPRHGLGFRDQRQPTCLAQGSRQAAYDADYHTDD